MESTLSRFFVGLALDPVQLADFLENPEAIMKSANLSEETRLVVRSADPELIADRLVSERGGPASAPWNCPGLLTLV
jgi:hypothetical protein